jgi:hypothetical protein
MPLKIASCSAGVKLWASAITSRNQTRLRGFNLQEWRQKAYKARPFAIFKK